MEDAKAMQTEECIDLDNPGVFPVYFCEECGCPDIEMAAWICPTTDTITASGCDGPLDQIWCPNCEDNHKRWDYKAVEAPTVEEAMAILRKEMKPGAMEQENGSADQANGRT